jgi:hypothetical protein
VRIGMRMEGNYFIKFNLFDVKWDNERMSNGGIGMGRV